MRVYHDIRVQNRPHPCKSLSPLSNLHGVNPYFPPFFKSSVASNKSCVAFFNSAISCSVCSTASSLPSGFSSAGLDFPRRLRFQLGAVASAADFASAFAFASSTAFASAAASSATSEAGSSFGKGSLLKASLPQVQNRGNRRSRKAHIGPVEYNEQVRTLALLNLRINSSLHCGNHSFHTTRNCLPPRSRPHE